MMLKVNGLDHINKWNELVHTFTIVRFWRHLPFQPAKFMSNICSKIKSMCINTL